ncbi:hypothetical protein DEU56DRAFT_912790 [Suillus clintonianus]|uniref:uncharacterized protein n=1 Tax=Suillus clintonianus TaxID=1904413 RepID=UPI001B86E489|nr:uncharacterized protein DEU56DRAFT_912790 [Suillus clintonianus]KAG2137019.1 hypothetical protein DEU56DRAFT_912790 [Suillus clintonianus]
MSHPDMTYIVSNDPSWWSVISGLRFASYFAVASTVSVVYDWVLTFAQEFELIWRRRWSFMTILYVSVRYIGILYSLAFTIWLLPFPMPDQHNGHDSCNILYFIVAWAPIVIDAALGLIIMTRLHAMYGRSNKMLIFLAAFLLVATIAAAVVMFMGNLGYSGGEAVLSGYHVCDCHLDTNSLELTDDMIIPTAIWEISAFCLAVRIVIKRFHELRQSQSQSRSAIGDCLTVFIQSHALYFLA